MMAQKCLQWVYIISSRPRRIENPRIVLLDCPLEYKKGESQVGNLSSVVKSSNASLQITPCSPCTPGLRLLPSYPYLFPSFLLLPLYSPSPLSLLPQPLSPLPHPLSLPSTPSIKADRKGGEEPKL